ncbi:MAG: iron-sulfur cluster repair di-iron protein, ric [Eubacteriales bacterium]|nr:iron-sulfur cluster repair di-iron protein, ric [Eubacteriales bacterium]
MNDKLTFNKAKKKYFKTLNQYVPIVARVHGGNHPEFHKVRELYEAINEKTKAVKSKTPDLTEDYTQLRIITNNYTVPDDVCESYEAVYNMLAETDKAYNN